MGFKREVEYKFLVHREKLPQLPPGSRMEQGYLSTQPTIRVRYEAPPEGEPLGFLTIKGSGQIGRDEFEYSIPAEEVRALFDLCTGSIVSKVRHRLPVEGQPDLKWEIDVFEGDNEGLIVAEIELPSPEHPFPRPAWLSDDVSDNRAYKNAALAMHPYRSWT